MGAWNKTLTLLENYQHKNNNRNNIIDELQRYLLAEYYIPFPNKINIKIQTNIKKL